MIIAIIPIKHNSSRVPGKNYRLMDNKPLYYYILNTLSNIQLIDKIIVDTNSPIISNGIQKYFPNIHIYNRPEHLSAGDISTNVLLLNVINELNLNADYYIHTHVTNPLLSQNTIINAINTFLSEKDNHDSLFTVNKLHTRFYNSNGQPTNHNLDVLIPTQDLEPIYEENSCLYIVPHNTLMKYKRRIGNKPYLLPIDKIEAQDIDWEEDFILTEFIMKCQNKQPPRNESKNTNKQPLYNESENLNKQPLYNESENINKQPLYNESENINKQLLYNESENISKRPQRNESKNVLITGISGGIGQKIGAKFRKKGWYVIGVDCYETNKNIDRFIHANLLDADFAKNIIENISENENKLHCLVNCAAMQINKKLIDTELEDWDNMINCNLRATYLLSQKCHELFMKNNIESKLQNKYYENGSIINISSVHSTNTSESISVYATSKAGLCGLTRAMSLEFARDNIRVNCISPGATNTQMLRDGLERSGNNLESISKKHVTGRIVEPKEIAEMTYFLANPGKSKSIIGQNIVIDGGATIRLSTE